MVGLCKTLLNSGFNDVMHGVFTTDCLENEFVKLREDSGGGGGGGGGSGGYFITVQNTMEKFQHEVALTTES